LGEAHLEHEVLREREVVDCLEARTDKEHRKALVWLWKGKERALNYVKIEPKFLDRNYNQNMLGDVARKV
jgi:hypothetical protein